MTTTPPVGPEHGPGERPTVAVYRDWLFKGSEGYIPAQAESLVRYRSHYLCMRYVPELGLPRERVTELNPGGRLGLAREIAFKRLGISPRLVRAVRRLRPALLHAHTGQDGAVILPVARRVGVPLVVTFHGFDANATDEAMRRAGRRSRVFLRRREALKREAALFIAVSAFIRGRLLAQGYPEERIAVHYMGVDREFFHPEPAVPREPVVLFVGRLIEVKGVAHLVAAMREVQARVPEAELVVAGRGPLRKACERQAQELGVRARFVGSLPRADVRAWMNRARVLCVPSVTAADGQREAFGTVFAEAQAMGLPVASFASGGVAEAVSDGHTGLLAREGETAALTANLVTLLTNGALWDQFSLAGMERVRTHFDLRRQSAALEELYDAVRARGAARLGGPFPTVAPPA